MEGLGDTRVARVSKPVVDAAYRSRGQVALRRSRADLSEDTEEAKLSRTCKIKSRFCAKHTFHRVLELKLTIKHHVWASVSFCASFFSSFKNMTHIFSSISVFRHQSRLLLLKEVIAELTHLPILIMQFQRCVGLDDVMLFKKKKVALTVICASLI